MPERPTVTLRTPPFGGTEVNRVTVEEWDRMHAIGAGFENAIGFIAVARNNEGFVIGAITIDEVDSKMYEKEERYRKIVQVDADQIFELD